jgi:hypothetical protein
MPNGTDFATTAVEPKGSDWRWDFYTYWLEMKPLYGNTFINDPDFSVDLCRGDDEAERSRGQSERRARYLDRR